MSAPVYHRFFDDGGEPVHTQLGGKCASLVALTTAGMPVPPGFAVTTAAYDRFLAESGTGPQIARMLAGLDPSDVAHVDDVSSRIRQLIGSVPIPDDVSAGIHAAYEALQSRFSSPAPVAVRSSATAEDLPDASFAGQQDTYLWLIDGDDVTARIRDCWASLYTSRAISYRLRNGVSDVGLSMAVAVQKMVNAKTAGVAMTIDPATGDRSVIVIDAAWGLGELVVSGTVTPDNITLDKVMLCVVREVVGDKHAELVPDADARSVSEREVPLERRTTRCITDDELQAIAAVAKRAERHFGVPQDIEWALDRDLPDGENLMLLQSRPETVWSQKKTTEGNAAPGGAGIESITRSLMAQIGR
jgi:pyruvate, water dikinase